VTVEKFKAQANNLAKLTARAGKQELTSRFSHRLLISRGDKIQGSEVGIIFHP